jgi:thiol-disulfide isomerase/thioredoxin
MSSRKICAKLWISIVPLFVLMSCGLSAVEERRVGIAAHDDTNYCVAVSHLEKALVLDPKDEVAHKYMAMSNERLDQFPQAKKQYEWLAKNAEAASDRDAAQTSVKRLQEYSGKIKPRIVLFSDKDCAFSKRFKPDFDRVAKEFKDKADFVIVDIDSPELHEVRDSYGQYITERFGDFGVPSFVFECKHGTIRDAAMGEETEEEFRAGIAKTLEHSNQEKEPG